MRQAFAARTVFDGDRLHADSVLLVEDGRIAALVPAADRPRDWPVHDLGRVALAPGLIDLQVNGGDGVMIDGAADAATLRRVCDAHARLGATGILPTLITDTAKATRTVIAAGVEAARQGVPGFLGLHLEGPHIDPRRKGAHDAALIRPMTGADLAVLCEAARALPALMVTVAPAAVTPAQVAALAAAGAVVSLGHADCTLAEARILLDAGARCVTHLFNAMSSLGSREPGLVGAALGPAPFTGLIADGVHVHPETIRLALAAKGTDRVFLVSDAMAVAGTALDRFALGNREILRRDGRLTLADGTLAGADLSLPQALATMIGPVGLAPEIALAMATSVPAGLIGAAAGRIAPGLPADLVAFGTDWQLTGVWRGGAPLYPAGH